MSVGSACCSGPEGTAGSACVQHSELQLNLSFVGKEVRERAG